MRFTRNVILLLLAGCGLTLGFWMLRHPLVPRLRGAPQQAEENNTAALPAVPDEGELHFVKTTVDLGLLTKETDYTFSFENRGKHTVKIIAIRSSCNCTTPTPEKRTLLPGEKGRILVNIKPRLERIGQNLYAVDVEYQGAQLRRTRLTLQAQHRPDIVVPDRLILRSVPGRSASVSFSVIDYRERPLAIKEIKTSSPTLQARVTQEPSTYLPGWQYRLEVSLSPDPRPGGSREESVWLGTTDPQREKILVRVTVQRAHRIRVSPSSLRLRAVKNQPGKQTGKLFIDDTEGESLTVLSARPSHPSLRCTLQTNPVRGGVLLEAELDESRLRVPHGPLTIRVVLNKPVREELCITVLPRSSPSSPSPP